MEHDNVIKTVGVVVVRGSEVLLVRHGGASGHITDTYRLPAGRIEQGETPLQAALRELEEETGLIGNKLQQLPIEYTAVLKRKDFDKKFHMIVFKCEDFEGKLKSDDEAIPEWVSLENLNSFETIPNVLNAINQALQFKS